MNTLYDIINILPVSLLTVMLFGRYAGIPENSLPGYGFCLVFTVWIILLRNMQRKNRFRSLGIAAVFTGGLYFAAGEEYRTVFAEEYIWLLWIAGFAAASLVIGILLNRNIWFRRIAAAAMVIYCITGTVLGHKIGKGVFVLICFWLFIRTAEEIQRRWVKSGSPDLKAHITRISPFFLAVCLLVFAMPAPDQPYDWKFAKEICQKTVLCFNRLYGRLTHPSEEYGTIGFSEHGGFLSGLSGNDDEVMYIKTDRKVSEFQLVGCVSGDFRGQEWVFDTGSSRFSRQLDTMETSCAVRKYDENNRSDFLRKTDLECEIRLYNTRYLFSPSKIKLEATRDRNAAFSEKNGGIIMKRRLNYKDSYTVSCFLLNYSHPALAAVLDNAAPITEEEWKQAANAEGVLEKKGCSYADYQKYRQEIYQEYCRFDDVSPEVREILEQIQSSAGSRYEAMKMLEAYLQQMEYSTDCGALPDTVTGGRRFLDYFLFVSQKGYCMHYATAFVLMANAMGIPCRYAQGYNVRREGNGDIIVRQSSAHAWPEVYFDNAGWVAFEPTPGYSDASGWEVSANVPNAFDQTPTIPDIGLVPAALSDEPEETEPESGGINLLIFVIPSLAVFGFLLLGYVISRSALRRKYQQMQGAEKYRYLTRQNLRFLGYLGCRMEEDETLSEFMDRMLRSDRPELREYLSFLPVYETVLYSDREITAEDIRDAEAISRSLRELVKKRGLRFRLLLLFRAQ